MKLLLNAGYFALLAIWVLPYFVIIPVPVSLVLHSVLILFVGCHRSLNLLLSEADGGGKAEEKEVLTAADAYKFPFIASAALFTLYIAFTYFDQTTVNLMLSVYFSGIVVVSLTSSFSGLFAIFITSKAQYGFKKEFPYIGIVDCLLSPAEIVCSLFACVFAYFYFHNKHFLMNNILGISFCIQSIERISIGSYKIGAILLTGLFFYDIFWVFGTHVMVKVATSFDGPIKLIFPTAYATAEVAMKQSILGLGDIVIPGFFISLMLRFDAVQAKVKGKGIQYMNFPKPYFYATLVAYTLGLFLTVGIMYFFKHAQPALLYLVPCCLLASLGMGYARGEVKALFSYDEGEEEVKEGEEGAKDATTKKKE